MKLDLTWTALFENGKILRQYDDEEQTKEHLFKEILESESPLRTFSLINWRSNRTYQVNLEQGRIHIFNPGFVVNPEAEVAGTPEHNYRLIYFRRVTRETSWGGQTPVDMGVRNIQYFLGYQYTTPEGRNIKRLLQITKDDEVYLT